MDGMTEKRKSRAPIIAYAIVAILFAIAGEQQPHAAMPFDQSIARWAGAYIGSFLLVVVVGELIRAVWNFFKKKNAPPIPPPLG